MSETQHERILNYLKEHGSITPMEAFQELGITRLAARVHELERMGIYLDREMEKGRDRYGNKSHYMRYWRAG